MRRLLAAATVALLLAPVSVIAGTATKDAFAVELEQQKDARRADLHELQEKQERVQELQEQRELEHPEIIFDEHEDDVEE
jgi:hypothetical protein